VKSGLCVDVQGGSTADGAKLVQAPVSGDDGQEWQPVGV